MGTAKLGCRASEHVRLPEEGFATWGLRGQVPVLDRVSGSLLICVVGSFSGSGLVFRVHS